MAALEALPDDVLLAILQRLSTDDDLLGVRCVSRRLRQQGAAAVRSLVATGGKLPAAAWRAFPGAIRLEVRLDEALSVKGLRGLFKALPARLAFLTFDPHSTSPAAAKGHVIHSSVPQLLASAAAAGLQDILLGGITSATAEQLLRGLPSLKRAHLETTALEAPPAAAVALQHFPPGLTSLTLHHSGPNGVDLDAAALAACSGLQRLHLKLLTGDGCTISSLGSLAALTSLQEMSVGVGFGTLAAQLAPELQVQLPARIVAAGQVYRGAVAAASQLPLLQDLDLRAAYLPLDSREPAWAQLAGMPALRRLTVWQLEVVPQQPVEAGSSGPAAPTTLAVTRLLLNAGFCGGQGTFSELQPGSLVALLPELRQLDVKSWQDKASDCSECSIATALQGHQQLQELRVDCSRPRRPQEEQLWRCWAPGRRPLSSMPRLRLLHLRGCTRLGLDKLLSDAAGCPELQELEVLHIGELCAQRQLKEEAVTGSGLAALAGGACRGRLRRLVLVAPGSLGGGRGFPICQVAALLGDGGCPQLEYLELHVQLDLGALVGLQLEQPSAVEVVAADVGVQQVDEAGMLQGWLMAGEVTEELECGMEHVELLLEKQLEALGVAGAELGFEGFVHLEGGGPRLHPVVKGQVGGCAVSWTLWA
jgi:hypothetical protein